MQSYGAYVVLLQAEFGWSKTVVAGAFALHGAIFEAGSPSSDSGNVVEKNLDV